MTRRLLLATLATLAASCKSSTPPTKGPVDMTPEVVTVPGKPGDPPKGADVLPLWPAVTKGVLPNGVTYYILKHGKPEKRAFLWLAVNAGSTAEDEDQRGLAHFVEHMAFNGTTRFPKDALVKWLESIGMRFGADLNAYTSFDETVYQLEVPSEGELIGKGLDVLRDWAGAVTFDPAEVDKERGVVTEEWRLGRGASSRIFDKQAKVLFRGSRYADRLTIGLPEILAKAPRDTLYRFYKDWYRPDMMAVIAVGDVDPATLEKAIAARFGDLAKPATPRAKPVTGTPKADGTRVAIETDKELTGASVSVYNLVPHRAEATEKDLRRSVVEQLYGTIINERLQSIGRKADAPFAMAFASVQGVTRGFDGFVRSAQVKGGKVEDAIRSLFTEVVRVEKHGFTQSELDRARANVARGYEDSVARESTSDSRRFASEITRNFFEAELMVGAKVESGLSLKVLPTVTLAELTALAASFGGAENRTILLQGPEGKPLPTQAQVLAIVDEVAKSAVTPWEDKTSTAKLMDKLPTPGKVTKEAKVDAIGVTEWTLSNGIRVIVKPADFEADEVRLSATSPGGLAMASDKDWKHARFADSIVDLGGLGDLDAEALERVLVGKRATANAFIGETTEGVSGSASPKDLETMFQLAHLAITAPRKDAEAIAVWRANSAERIGDSLRSPDIQYQRASTEAMFKNHLRRKPLDPADITGADADKAIAFYKDRFSDVSDFTFVILGTVDLATLKPLVETYLASLPSKPRKVKDVEKDLGIKRAAGVVKKTWELGVEPKGRVAITFHGDDQWSRDKDRDMFILGRVLSIRLREVLREDMGGVYGVGAGGNLTRPPRKERTLGISFGCDPEKCDLIAKAAFAELAKIAKDGIADDYLDKVKATFTRERETALRTNSFWQGWLLDAYRYGDDPKLILDPAPMLARMTAANVKAAAKKYGDPKQYFHAMLLPANAAAKADPKVAPVPTPAPKPAPKK
ncbi:MAG: insulinase family protein [Deltaproteobacteria bacterium]|nr:insulinase family protein [Deltaproteobacteria bacterium]